MTAELAVCAVKGHDLSIRGLCSQGYCRQCKDDHRAAARARRRAELDEYKLEAGCVKCGYDYSPRALDMHHRDPATKLFPIANATNYSKERFWAEVAKCDVMCRNCHAEEHET